MDARHHSRDGSDDAAIDVLLSRAEFARSYSGERWTADVGLALLKVGTVQSMRGGQGDLPCRKTEARRSRPDHTAGRREEAMEDAVGRMDGYARLGGMRLDVDGPLRARGIEAGVSPRRRSRDQELQRGQGQETESSERRTTIHRGLCYTNPEGMCNPGWFAKCVARGRLRGVDRLLA